MNIYMNYERKGKLCAVFITAQHGILARQICELPFSFKQVARVSRELLRK